MNGTKPLRADQENTQDHSITRRGVQKNLSGSALQIAVIHCHPREAVFRKLIVMDAPATNGPQPPRDLVTRRRLLWLAGAGGLGAAAATFSSRWFDGRTAGGATPTPSPPSAIPTTAPASPLAPPPTLSTLAPAPVSNTYLCRESWGAQPALPGGVHHELGKLTIHHTGAVLGDNRNAPARLLQHQRLHQGERGWIDIAYHFSVDREGNIYELRDPHIAGDTATEYDPTGHFLVLCEGDFDQETVSEEQLNSAATLFAWAAQQFDIPTVTLDGHRAYASTACPGADLYAHVASGDLRRRVDEAFDAGPINLREVCGPEADARVAAIESGQ